MDFVDEYGDDKCQYEYDNHENIDNVITAMLSNMIILITFTLN